MASEARATRSGPGRVLIAVYAIFALSATARAAVQIATKFTQAPLAYLLSALAGVVYIVATVALARGMRRLAWAAVGFELLGVLAVGTLTVLVARDFPDDTVWSVYGRGYGVRAARAPVRRPLVAVAHAAALTFSACG